MEASPPIAHCCATTHDARADNAANVLNVDSILDGEADISTVRDGRSSGGLGAEFDQRDKTGL